MVKYGPVHAARLLIESIAGLICAKDVFVSRPKTKIAISADPYHAFTAINGVERGARRRKADAAGAGSSDPPIPCEAIDSVGTARMSADGTITLRAAFTMAAAFRRKSVGLCTAIPPCMARSNAISAVLHQARPNRCRRCAGPIPNREIDANRRGIRHQTNTVTRPSCAVQQHRPRRLPPRMGLRR